MKTRRFHEITAAVLVASVFASVVLFAVAARAYPGGSHFDRLSVGHDFWRNTLCDVARSTALDGAPNAVGSSFARMAMTITAIGIGALFWLLPARFPSSPRLGAAVRVLGSISVPGAIAVVFLPTDRFGALHGIAIVIAGIPGLTAAGLAVVGLLRTRARPSASLVTTFGVLAVLVATAAFGIYVHELLSGGPPRMAVSVLERIAALLLLAWMVTVARASWLTSRSDKAATVAVVNSPPHRSPERFKP